MPLLRGLVTNVAVFSVAFWSSSSEPPRETFCDSYDPIWVHAVWDAAHGCERARARPSFPGSLKSPPDGPLPLCWPLARPLQDHLQGLSEGPYQAPVPCKGPAFTGSFEGSSHGPRQVPRKGPLYGPPSCGPSLCKGPSCSRKAETTRPPRTGPCKALGCPARPLGPSHGASCTAPVRGIWGPVPRPLLYAPPAFARVLCEAPLFLEMTFSCRGRAGDSKRHFEEREARRRLLGHFPWEVPCMGPQQLLDQS
ncbi:hypothetical protein M885DRAFT_261542 [Pelagophyceae sp. CCMP2097]|nr:hypothetical protein M885DRAFT_261542 [Pelagophyceae sp. CCMP2097]